MKNKFDLATVAIVLGSFLVMWLCTWLFVKQMDESWEARAKAAGYYDTLPDSMKNPKDLRK